ncbi:MAG: phosphate acyltransferase PlsX, partial [Myxococcales bacterium]|nr:phosphate acyltransferase PlsX [Myxococcales bacterium]
RYDASYLSVHHASQAIGMAESPKAALEANPDASLLVGARLVSEGAADALVSAGNTGAAILACARHFNVLPGVPRTALAAVVPTERRRGPHDDPFSLLLDVGATLDASADALVAFAHMGSAYAARISRNARPRVALLSNGEEPYKGPKAVIEAHARLKADPHINFIGNVEGVDLPRGKADVVVTAGFTGNVVLKMLEGISETVLDMARAANRSKLAWKAGLFMLRGGILQLKNVTDWQQYGGAPILGFDHLFIKAHGRSGQRAIQNALKVASKASRSNLCAEIAQTLRAQTPAPEAGPSGGGEPA